MGWDEILQKKNLNENVKGTSAPSRVQDRDGKTGKLSGREWDRGVLELGIRASLALMGHESLAPNLIGSMFG